MTLPKKAAAGKEPMKKQSSGEKTMTKKTGIGHNGEKVV
jgi:hypothetical protein